MATSNEADEATDALLLMPVARGVPPDANATASSPAPVPVRPVDLGESAKMPLLRDRGVPPSGVSEPRPARDAAAARAAARIDAEAPTASMPLPHGWPRLPPTARGGRSARVGVATADAAAVGGGGGGGGGDGGALRGTIAWI